MFKSHLCSSCFLKEKKMNEDPTVDDSAFNEISLHQWYLTQKTVKLFSFFADKWNEGVRGFEFPLISSPNEFRRGISLYKQILTSDLNIAILSNLKLAYMYCLFEKKTKWTANESHKMAENLLPNILN